MKGAKTFCLNNQPFVNTLAMVRRGAKTLHLNNQPTPTASNRSTVAMGGVS